MAILRLRNDFTHCGVDVVRRVHELIDFRRDKLTGPNVQIAAIDLVSSGLAAERTQETLFDQLLDTDLVTDMMKEVVGTDEATGLHPVRRRGEPDEPDMRIDDFRVLEKGLVHPLAVRRQKMAIMNQNSFSEIARMIFYLNVVHSDRACEFESLNTFHPDSSK